MKNYLFTLIALAAFLSGKVQAQEAQLNYDLTWNGTSSYIDVRLIYTPSTSDSTAFTFGKPGFGGQSSLFSVVSNLKGSAGDQLKIDSNRSRVIVIHKKNGLHYLTYRINGRVNTDNKEKAITMELFRPVITPNNLYLTPAVFMMNPEHHLAKQTGILLHGLSAATPVFFSWSPKAKPGQMCFIPKEKSGQFLIAAGKNIQIENLSVGGASYYSVTTKGDSLNNISAELVPYFRQYFPSIKNYWKDDDHSGYFLYLAQLQSAHRPFAGGINIGDGFIMKYFGKFDTWDKEIVAHETSHTWIGSKLLLDQSKADHQWFAEGFNDYVCLANLYHSGIFTQDTLIKFFNDRILNLHYSSNIKAVPNDSIPPNFWKDPAYRKLPYRRGALYAFYLDNQIQLASGGKFALRDMLLQLLKKVQAARTSEGYNPLTLEDFYAAAATYLPKETVPAQVERYMIRGEPINFKEVKLCPLFKFTFNDDVPVLSLSNQYKLSDFFRW
ncbi:hypothetical protein [Pedobacter sp. L105]|uniref:hypothetical protein n=1 Tax=Pedobacter sp. L105 TaxID=1641871 RepID=UPI00131CDC07|nr:hypothetical protein [Pedobacter sp. L105]